jgi:hypothetical protein
MPEMIRKEGAYDCPAPVICTSFRQGLEDYNSMGCGIAVSAPLGLVPAPPKIRH